MGAHGGEMDSSTPDPVAASHHSRSKCVLRYAFRHSAARAVVYWQVPALHTHFACSTVQPLGGAVRMLLLGTRIPSREWWAFRVRRLRNGLPGSSPARDSLRPSQSGHPFRPTKKRKEEEATKRYSAQQSAAAQRKCASSEHEVCQSRDCEMQEWERW